jgi:hypothetical protein
VEVEMVELRGRKGWAAATAVTGVVLAVGLTALAHAATTPKAAANPDLGPNVSIFDPSTPTATIQAKLNAVFKQQEQNQFGGQRFAMLFKPGSYAVDANVGFFTQVAGLGRSPDEVTIKGAVHAEADFFKGNATQNFWRSAENLSVTPKGGADRWAVSQGAPYRRIHLRGDLQLDDGGFSSGGLLADDVIDGQVRAGSQQQFLTRNSVLGKSWTGANFNMVFVGTKGAPQGNFPNPAFTRVDQTPVVREKPYLFVDKAGAFNVFVPAPSRNTTGADWAAGTETGRTLPLSDFFVVKPGATAAQINAALAAGKNLLVTPGVYHLNETLNVTRKDTVVLGLGLATFEPDNGVVAMKVADVDGVSIAGLLFDAGTKNSPELLEFGPAGSKAAHTADPSAFHDVYFRVGGAGVGKTTVALQVNSNDVIGDHTWIWRADHGDGVGFTVNTARNGLVVNGANVFMYGLFVEHFEQTDVLWNGNGGHTFFFQNELAYDPPNQAAFTDGKSPGFPAYEVAASVTTHQAIGLGSYCFFNVNPKIVADHAFQAPVKPGVSLRNMVTVSLGGTGTIAHVINNKGDSVGPGHTVTRLVQP